MLLLSASSVGWVVLSRCEGSPIPDLCGCCAATLCRYHLIRLLAPLGGAERYPWQNPAENKSASLRASQGPVVGITSSQSESNQSVLSMRTITPMCYQFEGDDWMPAFLTDNKLPSMELKHFSMSLCLHQLNHCNGCTFPCRHKPM